MSGVEISTGCCAAASIKPLPLMTTALSHGHTFALERIEGILATTGHPGCSGLVTGNFCWHSAAPSWLGRWSSARGEVRRRGLRECGSDSTKGERPFEAIAGLATAAPPSLGGGKRPTRSGPSERAS